MQDRYQRLRANARFNAVRARVSMHVAVRVPMKVMWPCLVAMGMTTLWFLLMTPASHAQGGLIMGTRKPLPKQACKLYHDNYRVSAFADTHQWVYVPAFDSWGPYEYDMDYHAESWRYTTWTTTTTVTHCQTNYVEVEGDEEPVEVCATLPATPTIDIYTGESLTLSSINSAVGINSPSMSQVLRGDIRHVADWDGHRVEGVVEEQLKFAMGACNAPSEYCEHYGRANVNSSDYDVSFTAGVTGVLTVEYEIDEPVAGVDYYHPHTSRVRLYYYDGVDSSPVITLNGSGTIELPIVPKRTGHFWLSGIQGQIADQSNIARQFNSSVKWSLPCKHPGDFRVSATPSLFAVATHNGKVYLPVTVRANHKNTSGPSAVAPGPQPESPEPLCGFMGSAKNIFHIYDLQVAVQAEYEADGMTKKTPLQVKTFTSPLLIGCGGAANFMLDITDYMAAGGTANSPLTVRGYVDPDLYPGYDDSPIARGGEYEEWDEMNNVDVDRVTTIISVPSDPIIIDTPSDPQTLLEEVVGTEQGVIIFLLEGVTQGGTLGVTPIHEEGAAAAMDYTRLATSYEISATDLHFGRATVALPYADAEVEASGLPEAALRLLHYAQGTWHDVTTGLDMETNTITGTVDGFSTLAIGAVLLEPCTVQINNGADFTGQREVQLFSQVVDAQQIMVAADAAFTDAEWQVYHVATPWTLDVPADQIAASQLYVRVADEEGTLLCDDLSDTIGYDPLAPSLTVTHTTAMTDDNTTASSTVELQVDAVDQVDGSGVTAMQVSDDPAFGNAVWKPYVTTVSVATSPPRTVYVRVRDGAGNHSATVSIEMQPAEPDDAPDDAPEPEQGHALYLPSAKQ